MKSRRQLYVLVIAASLLTACSTAPQYVIEPDYDYIQKVETPTKFGAHAARIYWVNPPIKREKLESDTRD
jgi:starvation-inducible outer membrane lipoprotein